ncbi:efflux transporter outer membrane subunit [Zavarzinia sp. CC-PAN008]|uniref:efflux transporter outer membrane subunit n=1 Tax=Zavarzinia sp. CC-PAN008 TaxID=3243332 RepID=UPI003F746358
MARLFPTLLAGGTLLLAAGCTVGPDYHRPEVASATTFRAAAAEQGRGAAPAPAAETWWRGFDDPLLTRVVERALAANLDIAQALARLDQAAVAARLARADLLPAGAVDGGAGVSRGSLEGADGASLRQPGVDRVQDFYSLGAAASWELDLFGGERRGLEAAQAQAEAAAAGVGAARVTVAAEAADAYLQARTLQNRLDILTQQVANQERLRELVRLRLERGIAARRELDQVETLLSQSRAGLPAVRAGLEAQLNRLDVLMGAVPGTWRAELAASQPLPRAPRIAGLDDATALLRQRPDVVAAERQLAAANARIGEATAEYYPKFSLSALLGFDSLSAGNLLTAGGLQAQGLLGLRWRLFDFARVDAQVAGAEAGTREALAAYRQSVLRAAEDVETAIVALVESEAQARELENSVASAERARLAVHDAYAGGAVSVIEVLDAERQELAAEDGLVQARGQAVRAAVRSFRALGAGWTPDPTQVATASW